MPPGVKYLIRPGRIILKPFGNRRLAWHNEPQPSCEHSHEYEQHEPSVLQGARKAIGLSVHASPYMPHARAKCHQQFVTHDRLRGGDLRNPGSVLDLICDILASTM